MSESTTLPVGQGRPKTPPTVVMKTTPQWDETGEPLNLAAAATDALDWLKAIKRFADGGKFRFEKHAEIAERLAGAITGLEKFLNT